MEIQNNENILISSNLPSQDKEKNNKLNILQEENIILKKEVEDFKKEII